MIGIAFDLNAFDLIWIAFNLIWIAFDLNSSDFIFDLFGGILLFHLFSYVVPLLSDLRIFASEIRIVRIKHLSN